MSRRKQKKAKRKEGFTSHHILHYRRWWDTGYRQLLRRAFVYDLPAEVHQLLHATVGAVPPLDDGDAKWLWTRYCENGRHFDDIFDALEWLRLNAPNSDFAIAIMTQHGFLQNKLGRSE